MSLTASDRDLRDAFGTFATGVTVVTAVRPDGAPVGVTANSFTSVSLNPPLLLWCLANASASRAAFTLGSEFAVHVLTHEQRDLALHFARRSAQKFEVDAHWQAKPHPPLLADALCRFDCRVHSLIETGDHIVVFGSVQHWVRGAGAPLTFHAGKFGAVVPDRHSPHIDVWSAMMGEWF